MVVLVFLCLAVAVAPAQAILNGQPDENRHPYVGMVFDDLALCSGFLISPTVFVTAGHCTRVFERPDGGPVQITFNPDATAFEGQVTGTPYTHPDFCFGCQPNQGFPGVDTHDVGVVVLDAPVEMAEYGVLPDAGLVDRLGPRTLVTSVGYGIRERPKDLQGELAVPLAVRYFAESALIPSNDVSHDELIKTSTDPGQGKGGICRGDSGGPTLLDGSRTVLGITVLTSRNCTVAFSYRIDIPDALSFIESFL